MKEIIINTDIKKGIIYWSKTCGLANRLSSIFAYMAMSKSLDVPFYLYWEKNWACNIDINQIFFKDNLNLIDKNTFSKLKKDKNLWIFKENYMPVKTWKNHLSTIIDEDTYLNQVSLLKNVLIPSDEINKKISGFLKNNDLTNAVGIHIRMTDNINAFTYSKNADDYDITKVSKISGFEKFIIDRVNEDDKQLFYLATDNKNIEKYLISKFKNNIIIYPKIFYTFNYLYFISLGFRNRRTTTIEDALIDMLLLGKCKYIVGTYYSSFSRFSAWWGGREYYQVIGDKIESDIVKVR